jgi:hypothetical protein
MFLSLSLLRSPMSRYTQSASDSEDRRVSSTTSKYHASSHLNFFHEAVPYHHAISPSYTTESVDSRSYSNGAYIEDVMPRLVRPPRRAAWRYKRAFERRWQDRRFGAFIGAYRTKPICLRRVASPSENGTDRWQSSGYGHYYHRS